MIPTIKDIEAAIGHTWFDWDSVDGDIGLSMSTRENGDVGEESHGTADWEEAKRIRTAIDAKYPGDTDFDVTIDYCDEWVNVDVCIKESGLVKIIAPKVWDKVHTKTFLKGLTSTQLMSIAKIIDIDWRKDA